MTYPNQGGFARSNDEAGVVAYDHGLREHMIRVYNFMTAGLGVTGLVALLVASVPALHATLLGTQLKWVVMLAPLAFVLVMSWRFDRMSSGSLQALFWAYCGVMGLSMAAVFLAYTTASIALVFFVTASMFGAMSLWGYTTKSDLSRMGSFLMMGLIGIVIASLANILIGSSALQFAVTVIGVVVFTGLTAYDTQAIKESYAAHHGHEANGKLAVMGALNLYLNFVNLFQMLLQLVGQRED